MHREASRPRDSAPRPDLRRVHRQRRLPRRHDVAFGQRSSRRTFVSIVGVPLALAVSVTTARTRSAARHRLVVARRRRRRLGIGCFYLAMGRGLISIVAPVAAVTGAVVPVVYALVTRRAAGADDADHRRRDRFVAVAVVSLAPSEQHASAASVDRSVIALALASGCFSGSSTSRSRACLTTRGSGRSRSSARGVVVVLGRAGRRPDARAVRRTSRNLTGPSIVIAVLEIAATVPLLLALQRGPVAVASVVASLYPVTTVLLAGDLPARAALPAPARRGRLRARRGRTRLDRVKVFSGRRACSRSPCQPPIAGLSPSRPARPGGACRRLASAGRPTP